MATSQNSVPVSKKDQIKQARRAVAPFIKDVLTAEAVLLDAQIAASPHIAALISKSGNPSHKITLDRGTNEERKVLMTARKIGDYVGDASGAPVTIDAGGSYPAGAKTLPIYGLKVQEEDEDEDE